MTDKLRAALSPTTAELIEEANDWLEKMKDRAWHPLIREGKHNDLIRRLSAALQHQPPADEAEWVLARYEKELGAYCDAHPAYAPDRETRIACMAHALAAAPNRMIGPAP